MKKTVLNLVFAAIVVLCSTSANAQQDPYVTHYMFNRTLYNPAAVGANGKFCLTALSHYQYTGFEDRTPEFHAKSGAPPPQAIKSVGPKTQMFSFSAPFNFKDPSGQSKNYGGVGIGFINDKLGYEFSTHVKIAAAGRLPMSNGSSIALGAEYNFLQKGIDGTRLLPLSIGDPSIPTQKQSEIKPNYTAGLYYDYPMLNNGSWENMWASLSMSQLKAQRYNYGTTAVATTVSHLYLMGGITKLDFLGKSDLKFHPSFFFKRAAVNQIELTGLLEYQQKLWGGLAYRSTSDALSVLLGYSGFKGSLKGLRIGYSYDLTLTRILSVSSGTHEIQLNYCFEIKLPLPTYRRIFDPRHLNKDINLD
jgi:type IX secretion system PorP/SprF family membrane protein